MPFIEGGAQTTTKKTTQPAAASGTVKPGTRTPGGSGPTPARSNPGADEWDQYNQNATVVPDPSWDQKIVGGILGGGEKALQGAATAAKKLGAVTGIGNPSSPVSGGNGSSGTVKPGTRTPGGSGVTTVTPSGSPGSDVGSASGSGAGSGTSGSGSGSGTGSGFSGGYGGGSYGGGSGSSGGGSGSGSGSGSSASSSDWSSLPSASSTVSCVSITGSLTVIFRLILYAG